MALNIRKHKVKWGVGFALFVLVVFACYSFISVVRFYFGFVPYRPTAEEIFSQYLTYSDSSELLNSADNLYAEELSMGQGVYIRFEAEQEAIINFLEHDQANPNSYHYPYEIVACQDFYEAYADWADNQLGFDWWRPREVASPECYVTKACEYFLLDKESDLAYYYFFPDFLGRDYFCVE